MQVPGIMGLVYLRCFPAEGRPEPVPEGALGPRAGRGCFCVVSGLELGLEAG